MAPGFQIPPEVIAIFREEVRELLESLVTQLDALNGEGDDLESRKTRRIEVKRSLHNVKGAASSVGFTELARIAHAAEDRLAEVTDSAVVPKALIEHLFAAIQFLLGALESDQPAPAELLAHLGLDVPAPAVGSVEQPSGAPATMASVATAATRSTRQSTAPRGLEASVRIKSSTLDALLPPLSSLTMLQIQAKRRRQLLSELVLNCESLAEQATRGPLNPRSLAELGEKLQRLHQSERQEGRRAQLALSELEDLLRRMRLVPFRSLEASLRLTVREAAAATGKEVNFVIQEEGLGLDRRHLELLKAPLMHLLRNAVDHGLENPQQRQSAGEDPKGQILMRFSAAGDQILIHLEDDGRGMDLEAIRARALASGLVDEPRLASMDEPAVYALTCIPGFSTRQQISSLSGRGVGLDIVCSALEQAGGRLLIEPRQPKGTRFTLQLPASLLTTKLLRFRTGPLTLAIPVRDIEQTSRVALGNLYQLDDHDYVDIGDQSARVLRFHTRGREVQPAASSSNETVTAGPQTVGSGARVPAIVMNTGQGRGALLVDEIFGDEELVVQALGAPFTKLRGVLGASVGGAGEVIPVLNPVEILELDLDSLQSPATASRGAESGLAGQPATASSILVVDDSITTRTLERHVLESHGYLVDTANDGAAGLALLKAGHFDLLVSDVEMPELDGIALVTQVRAEPAFAHLPIVLVTSLGSEGDQARGLAAGADAYIIKRRFDQAVLLKTIEALLTRSH